MAMSRTSRCILSALHKADNPLSQDKLLVQINNNLSQKGNEPMTDNAYRRVLMILMGCYFVSMNENAEYSISTTGKKLFEIIKPIT